MHMGVKDLLVQWVSGYPVGARVPFSIDKISFITVDSSNPTRFRRNFSPIA